MSRILTKNEVATLRNIFKANGRNYRFANKLSAKIAEMEAEKQQYLDNAAKLEAAVQPLMAKVGCSSTNEMFKEVTEAVVDEAGHQKVSKDGKPVFVTKVVVTFVNDPEAEGVTEESNVEAEAMEEAPMATGDEKLQCDENGCAMPDNNAENPSED